MPAHAREPVCSQRATTRSVSIRRSAALTALCLWKGAGAAQSVGIGREVGKVRLAVMGLNGSMLRIQQTQGQMPQGGGVQTTQTVNQITT